jgi:RES domain-containing protein
VKLYRARGLRRDMEPAFDALDAAGSVAGLLGWRFNDIHTPILYTAEVEALAILEVAVRPGWESIRQVLIATVEIPDGAVSDLGDLGLVLPRNWNARPVAPDSRSIAREFLNAVARLPDGSPKPLGVRVPSVLSSSDFNVLLDPSRKSEYTARIASRIPFATLRETGS